MQVASNIFIIRDSKIFCKLILIVSVRMMNTLCALRRSRAGSKWSQTGSQRLRTERTMFLRQWCQPFPSILYHIKSKTVYWEEDFVNCNDVNHFHQSFTISSQRLRTERKILLKQWCRSFPSISHTIIPLHIHYHYLDVIISKLRDWYICLHVHSRHHIQHIITRYIDESSTKHTLMILLL